VFVGVPLMLRICVRSPSFTVAVDCLTVVVGDGVGVGDFDVTGGVGVGDVLVGAGLVGVGAALVVSGTTGRTPAGWVETTEVAFVNAVLAVRPRAKIAPMLRIATPARIKAYSTAEAPPS
jgi:hypothetical protein